MSTAETAEWVTFAGSCGNCGTEITERWPAAEMCYLDDDPVVSAASLCPACELGMTLWRRAIAEQPGGDTSPKV